MSEFLSDCLLVLCHTREPLPTKLYAAQLYGPLPPPPGHSESFQHPLTEIAYSTLSSSRGTPSSTTPRSRPIANLPSPSN